MRSYRKNSALSVILTILVSLIIIAGLFCVVTLVYGACTDMTFVEVLKSWFTPNNVATAVEEAENVATTTAHLMGM